MLSLHGALLPDFSEGDHAPMKELTIGRNDAGQRRRRRRGPNPLFIILVAVFCVALIAVAAILIHMGKARSDFRKLSEMVEENATATAAPVETTPPETRSTGPTTETTVPTEPEPTEPVMLAKYAPLYEQNHDLFGWLRIDGTVIDYPVMHTPTDPEKYLHTNFKREYSFGGIPFIDANCSADSDNLLIYGHNMLDGSMFRTLLKYQQKDFWQRNPVISFNTLYEEQEYEVVAAFYDKVYKKSDTNFKFYQFYDTSDQSSFDEAMAYYREHALYDTGVTAQCGDLFLTLVTCAYQTENGRFVVVARKK